MITDEWIELKSEFNSALWQQSDMVGMSATHVSRLVIENVRKFFSHSFHLTFT